MKKTFSRFLTSSLVLLTLTGCGSNNDLIDILDNSTFPLINTFATGGAFYNTGSAFTASTPYWTFSANNFGSYAAPARGVIAEIGTSGIPGMTSTSYVTIIHSGRLATRVHGLSLLNVRSGDVVQVGMNIGTFLSNNAIAFQVLVDGIAVCPLSYVSETLRVGLFSNPCR